MKRDCHVPGPGDEWEMGCPKSPMWESGDEAWSEDESTSSDAGQAVRGNARGLVAGLPLLRGPLSQQEKPFSHRGRAVAKREGRGERK